ncbi:predicted protein [Sclerotinia sclerotiorum 1980 UF-70]|uniref:Uncharacterized protein n=1 Tax=Sclerotinia sclerotiorum (strain ATCC 18683 / 1980 / Ss-1) TaxID=665079 RepID=A7EUJ4_SCLS1|nr:predicted protein [Sclerotinia sclerotiorum 1980 UF-70]EDN93136.1 predicted protein [Sclerotinia sclerotiorum 1980 UF-70]
MEYWRSNERAINTGIEGPFKKGLYIAGLITPKKMINSVRERGLSCGYDHDSSTSVQSDGCGARERARVSAMMHSNCSNDSLVTKTVSIRILWAFEIASH